MKQRSCGIVLNEEPPTIIVVGDFYLGKLYLTFINLYVNLYLELKINVKSLKIRKDDE